MALMRDQAHRASLMIWALTRLHSRGPDLEWITISVKPIKKASLSFTVKFWWALVRSQI